MINMGGKELILSIVGAFVATLLAFFFSMMVLQADSKSLVLASTGATAMLLFGLPHSTVSMPWNVIGGHLVSAVVGVSCYQWIPNELVASSASIAIAMAAMHGLQCMHPPGGATAITAVVGGVDVHALGYAYVVVPVFFNAIILLSIAMAVATLRNNNPFYE